MLCDGLPNIEARRGVVVVRVRTPRLRKLSAIDRFHLVGPLRIPATITRVTTGPRMDEIYIPGRDLRWMDRLPVAIHEVPSPDHPDMPPYKLAKRLDGCRAQFLGSGPLPILRRSFMPRALRPRAPEHTDIRTIGVADEAINVHVVPCEIRRRIEQIDDVLATQDVRVPIGQLHPNG
jgi:hypothetical protein